MLSGLCADGEYPILVGDRESISRIVNDALNQKDVVFCRVDDANGNSLAEAGSKEREPVREFTALVLTKVTRGEGDERMMLGAATEVEEEIGDIHLGISLSGLNKKIAAQERAAAVFAAFTTLLVSIAGSLLLRFILRDPITALVKGTTRIASGELSYRVPVRSNDEIGVLAISFNKMVEHLASTLVSKNYVDNIIRSMTDTLVVTDPEGRIRTANRATLDLLEYSEQELIGKPLCILFKEDRLNETEIAGLKNGIGVSNVEKTYVSAGGRRIPVLFSSSVMLDQNGQTQGIVYVAQDITKRRLAEEQLALQAEELARSNVQLEQANAELMKLDHMKSDFVSNVSHELRTPLTAVKAYSETLLEYNSLSEEQRESFVKVILEQTNRLATLVDDLLDLSKIEAGELKMELEPINVDGAIATAMRSVGPGAQKEGIEINVCPSQEGSYVLADGNRLVQILVNLLNNSVKFTGQDGRIDVISVPVADSTGSSMRDEEKPAYLRITISDNGIGIAAEELDRVFDKFKQVAEKTRGKPAGTGLGLTICRSLVQAMGGRIWVESTVGKGCRFHFTLPLAHAPEPERDGLKVHDGQAVGELSVASHT